MSRFPDNSRICFVGDSITNTNLYLMHIVSYYKKNYADKNINFYNCGVSGTNLTEHLKTVEEDILSYNPTHVVILMGVNDCDRSSLKEERSINRYERLKLAFEKYKSNLSKICNIFKEKNIEITLCTCVPYDEYGSYCTEPLRGGMALIMAYNEYIRNYARENNFGLCDYHPYMIEKMQNEQIYCEDSVHPIEKGHYYIAQCFFKYQGIDFEETLEFSEKLNEWNDNVQKLRNIYAVEAMIIKNYNLPFSEAAEIAKDYIENGDNLGLITRTKSYITDKPNKQTLKDNVIKIMEKEL